MKYLSCALLAASLVAAQPCLVPGKQGVCMYGDLTPMAKPAKVKFSPKGAAPTCYQTVFPSEELCDGVDNDCDGSIDEVPFPVCYGYEGETETASGIIISPTQINVGQCRAGVVTCNLALSSWECTGMVLPDVDICDGIDNDCDGTTDDADTATCTDTEVACQHDVCNGASGCQSVADPSTDNSTDLCDQPDNECVVTICTAGSCGDKNVADETFCGVDGDCYTHKCASGVCTQDNFLSTVTCPGGAGECYSHYCDGNGSCEQINTADGTPCEITDPCYTKSCSTGSCTPNGLAATNYAQCTCSPGLM